MPKTYIFRCDCGYCGRGLQCTLLAIFTLKNPCKKYILDSDGQISYCVTSPFNELVVELSDCFQISGRDKLTDKEANLLQRLLKNSNLSKANEYSIELLKKRNIKIENNTIIEKLMLIGWKI